MKAPEHRSEAGVWDKTFIILVPQAAPAFNMEVEDCLEQLGRELSTRGLDPRQVVKQSFFIKAEGPGDYQRKSEACAALCGTFYKGCAPPTSCIAQAPQGGRRAALEVTALAGPSGSCDVLLKTYGGSAYTVIHHASGREILAAGILGRGRTVEAQAGEAFARMEAILNREGLGVSHVVRQWNYIENILGRSRRRGRIRQNYQMLNEARALSYRKACFPAGYPAATGIGMDTGGFLLEFIAWQGKDDVQVVPVSNPGQVDAHRYSADVLVGESPRGRPEKRPPMFERAKVLAGKTLGLVYISGTAAIAGQAVAGDDDITVQTETTIENIRRLVSEDNLRSCGLDIKSLEMPLLYCRSYVKKASDIPVVQSLTGAAFPKAPSLAVVSDICRDALLVEIEGAVRVKTA